MSSPSKVSLLWGTTTVPVQEPSSSTDFVGVTEGSGRTQMQWEVIFLSQDTVWP